MQRDIWLGNEKLHCDFEDKNTLRKSQSPWTAISLAIQVSRKKHDGIGGSDWQSWCEIWIHSSGLDSLERWRSGVPLSGEWKVKLDYALEIHYTGIWECQLVVKIQSDSSTAKFFDGSVGSRTSNVTH